MSASLTPAAQLEKATFSPARSNLNSSASCCLPASFDRLMLDVPALAIRSNRASSPGNRWLSCSFSIMCRAWARAAWRRVSSMRNGGAPASSRLLLESCRSSFSAAASSRYFEPEDAPAAENERGVGCLLLMSLWTSRATSLPAPALVTAVGGLACAVAQGSKANAKIEKKIADRTAWARSISWSADPARGSPENFLTKVPLSISHASF